MNNKSIILLLILNLCQPLIATNISRGCFTNAIYEDDGRPDDSHEEKILRLQRKKHQAIKVQLLDPLDNEIEHLKSSIGLKKGAIFVVGLIGAFLYPPSAIAMIPIGYKFAVETAPIEQKISELTNSKQEIIRDLKDWELGSWEHEYVREKQRIAQVFRDRIESLLIEDYETGADHKTLIRDLLFFPAHIECLSRNGDEDQFVEGLIRAEAQLAYYPTKERFAATDTLATLARASFNALLNKVPSRCAIYFETGRYDRALSLFQHLAYILNRSYFVVVATKDSLSHEYLFGNKTQRGIVLEAFLAQRNNSSLNPLLIVVGIDEWMSDDNLSILLPILDPDPPNKMIHSNYFGLAIDWSAMSVLSCGKKPSRGFPGPIRSRIHTYKIE